ncbi:MAG TPA: PaaI family thioesterase [Actinomycetota bacterium]|nr:PaaI family thioesterase [Actinomycetota bacterium]
MIVEEPVRGSFAYLEQPGLFALPGLDQLRAFAERRLPAPPLTHLSGLIVDDAEEGSSRWSIPASPWWSTAAGVFPGGALAFVADAALAGSVFTTLPPATALLSSDLSINFLEPAFPSSGRLAATGTVIHSGRRQGLSEARVEDASGRLLAHATSRCVVQPLPFEPPEAPSAFPGVEEVSFDSPDPYLRPLEGGTIQQEVWDATSGLEFVQLWAKGERPAAPVCLLLGLGFADVEEGSVTVSMPASMWFCTGFGTFYGGAVSAFADAAITSAVMTTLPKGASFGTLDLKVNFLRPVTPDGRDLIARATVEQRGHTIAVTTCRLDDAGGRRIAMASGSAMISADRPWPRDTA